MRQSISESPFLTKPLLNGMSKPPLTSLEKASDTSRVKVHQNNQCSDWTDPLVKEELLKQLDRTILAHTKAKITDARVLVGSGKLT